MSAGWSDVTRALDAFADRGRTIRVWLRDDDAVAVTPALEQLRILCGTFGMPMLLAVIPLPAEPALGAWMIEKPGVTPCQHGICHQNHAADGQRACELGGARALEAVVEDLWIGRQKLQALFGPRLSDILVPPWNRIDPAIVTRLPALGFTALSTFGPPPDHDGGIPRINADLDIIDWRAGRVGRSLEDVFGKLTGLVASAARGDRPIGILTHHLAHDEQAWAVLNDLLDRLSRHPAVVFTGPCGS